MWRLTKIIAWKQFLGVQCARSPPGFTYMSLEQDTLHLHWFSGLKKEHTALTSFWKTINWTITGFTVGAEKYTKCLFVNPLRARLQYLRLVEHCGMCDSYTLCTLSTLNFSSASRLHLSCHRPPPLWQYLPTLWSRDTAFRPFSSESQHLVSVVPFQCDRRDIPEFRAIDRSRFSNPSACSWELLVETATAGEFWISWSWGLSVALGGASAAT